MEAKKIHDDFDEVIEDYDGPLTIGMQQALVDSEIGPQVAYYLASNRKEAERIGKMTSLVEINKAIGKSKQSSKPDRAARARPTSLKPQVAAAHQSGERFLEVEERRGRYVLRGIFKGASKAAGY